jgi:TonB family protein
MKSTIQLALLLACGAAQASEWVSIKAATSKDTEFLVDVSSVHRSGEITRAWVKIVYARHTQRGTGENSKKWATFSQHRYAYTCGEGNAEVEALSVYFEDGTHWEAPSWTLGGTEPVPPDTVGEAVMKFVCSWRQASQNIDPQPTSQNSAPPVSDVSKLTPAQPIKTIRMPSCGEDYYPAQALRLNQQGSVVVKLCIGVNNKIDGPVEVVTSSGFPLLDEAAGKCVGAGSYRAGVVNGVPARTCKEVSVHFAPLAGR